MTSERFSAERKWGCAGVDARERAATSSRRLEGADHQRLEQVASFARAINSDGALVCQLGSKGQPPVLVCSRALGAARELAARLHEGGFVDRALGAQRAVLGSLYPLLDRRLAQASHPPLTHAVAAPCAIEGFPTEARPEVTGENATRRYRRMTLRGHSPLAAPERDDDPDHDLD